MNVILIFIQILLLNYILVLMLDPDVDLDLDSHLLLNSHLEFSPLQHPDQNQIVVNYFFSND